MVVEQMAADGADGVGADAPALYRRVDVDVEAGVAVIGLLLRRPLDPSDDPAVDVDHGAGGAEFVEVALYRRHHVVAAPPPLVDLGSTADPGQLGNVVGGGRSQPDDAAKQDGHCGQPTGRPRSCGG